jgi:uncharacterized repeat protein (TIGR03843 family)
VTEPLVPGTTEPLAEEDALVLLTVGELALSGRLVDASNATLFGTATLDGMSLPCVYKPIAGERPLWDFPDGTLAGREVSAYLVSRASGWGLVPPTVLRDGPLGPGMCQLWITAGAPDSLVDVVLPGRVPAGWRTVLAGRGYGGRSVLVAHADDPRLRRMAVLDVVLNNADRKGGHLLPTDDGALYGCDHGICFHVEEKLRTLLWGWAGEPLTDEARDMLAGLVADLDGSLGGALSEHLTRAELRAARRRAEALRTAGRHPEPGNGWPAVPWPIF